MSLPLFRRIALLILHGILCTAEQVPVSPADTAAEVTSSEAPAIFRSATNLVQVPVVVRDSSGHAVGTLQQEDFQLLDGGKAQAISQFSVEKFSVNTTLIPRTQNQDPNAIETSAAPAAASLPDRFIAMLADDVNLNPQDFTRGRNAALHYVDTLHPDERIAVYAATNGLRLDFTDDRDRLKKTLLDINSIDRTSHYGIPFPDVTKTPCHVSYFSQDRAVYQGAEAIGCPDGGAMGVGPQVLAEIYHIMETWGDADERTYLQSLKDLIAKMSAMPGERSILLVSPGIYVPARFRQQFKDILASAVKAKVIINGVDARGVLGSSGYSASGRSAPGRMNIAELGDQQGGTEFMEDITSGTGGIYVHGDNDLDRAIQRTESVPEFVYMLGFSPSDLKFDGKRHLLKVALKNPRGYSIQARIGYFADTYATDPVDEVKQKIEEAFFSNEEVKGLPVRLQAEYFKDGEIATVTVTAKVDASKLPFRKEDGRNRDDLTLVVGLFDQNGNFLSAYRKIIEMRLKDSTLNAWLKSGIENSTDFSVKPGKYLVRLVVRDSEGQAMAEQSTGLDIPWSVH